MVKSEPSVDEFFEALKDGSSAAPMDEGKIVSLTRDYLAASRRFLTERHQAGGLGREINELHSALMDRLVRRLFWFAEETYFSGGGEAQTEFAVVAVGGYARREMNIHSDVDLLLLHRDRITPFVQAVTERLQYWMWDGSLQVGCAIRTIDETISLAKKDITVRTGILEPRFLAGSGVLFHEFAGRQRAELFEDAEAFIAELMRSAAARHKQYGDSLYLLQPNVKEGEGTLRDHHAAYWAMQAAHPIARNVDEFLHLGLLTEDELREYREALDFLWRIRNELHVICGRKNDQMTFAHQEKIAAALGYGEAAANELPVERFMADFYRHARAVRTHSTLVIEQCQARVERAPRERGKKEVEHGFRISDGRLEIPHTRMLRESPLNLLAAFAVAQRHDIPLTRKARRLIRENLHVIDDAFRSDRAAAELFLAILQSEKRVMRTLMAMNEEGLLGAFLPEWAHIVFRWQHVMYHTYTVDVHSIFLVEELRRLWQGRYEQGLPEVTDLMRGVDDRAVLFLGCLLHDIGKGLGGEHSRKGAVRARACVERLGLSTERADRVVFLVEHHLLMSHLAMSRDLTGPELIFEFARTVGNRTNLRDLYLLTFADIRASSTTAWTQWKGQLLRELFERTSEFIETGADDKDTAAELIERRVGTRRDGAVAELRKLGIARSQVEAYVDMMPHRYFIAHEPRQIARHALVVFALDHEKLVSTAVREMPQDSSEFILCTRDVHGLYANVAGTLTAHEINILGANVYTTRTGLALEVYQVATPPGGEDERRIAWAELDRSLKSVLAGDLDVETLLRHRGRRVGLAAGLSKRNPIKVGITNEESDFYTIVDVTANDRLGLLHDLTQVIADLGYEIYISKAATVLDQVTDTFYIKDAKRKKLQDGDAIERLRTALQIAAKGGEATRDGG